MQGGGAGKEDWRQWREKRIINFDYHCLQNAGRILRGLFEIALHKGQPSLTAKLLRLCKCVDHRLWMFDHPLRQFSNDKHRQALDKLEEKKMTLDKLRDMSADEIGEWSEGVGDGEAGEWSEGVVDGEVGEWSEGVGDGEAGEWSEGVVDGEVGEWSEGVGDGEAGEWSEGVGDGEAGEWSEGVGDGVMGWLMVRQVSGVRGWVME